MGLVTNKDKTVCGQLSYLSDNKSANSSARLPPKWDSGGSTYKRVSSGFSMSSDCGPSVGQDSHVDAWSLVAAWKSRTIHNFPITRAKSYFFAAGPELSIAQCVGCVAEHLIQRQGRAWRVKWKVSTLPPSVHLPGTRFNHFQKKRARL